MTSFQGESHLLDGIFGGRGRGVSSSQKFEAEGILLYKTYINTS